MTVLARLRDWVTTTGCVTALVPDETGSGARPALVAVTQDGSPAAESLAAGGSVLNDLATISGADLEVVTAATAGLTAEDVLALIAQGQAQADAHADAATPLLLVGMPGADADAAAAAAAVIGTRCNVEPVNLLRAHDPDWQRRVILVRDLMFTTRRLRRGPATASSSREILRMIGTAELAVVVGLLSQAAERRTPVILDGPATLAAALLAEALRPGSADWWLAPHTPDEPSAPAALRRLSLSPIHDADLGLPGTGCGAGLAVLPMVRTAAVVADRDRTAE